MNQCFSSVWLREPRAAKSSTLSRAQIVRVAVQLLDAEGLEALSMRRLATRLGSGATSIYWHVATKDDLLELVLDEVYGGFTVLDVEETTWRNAASSFAYGMRQILLQHPWAINLVGKVPSIGPNAMRILSRLIRTFEHAGFRDIDQHYAASALMSYVAGVTAPEISWNAALDRSGLDSNEWNAAMQPTVRRAAADYPELVARYAEFSEMDVDTSRALNFEFGLTCLLDGLEARLNRSIPPPADPPAAPDARSGARGDGGTIGG
ncbi:AcrR family transcriptional regulator [Streptosporangium album]|uniref:AcrR family transcriptional regulator n=1 Tax=Streptosporangium album TaxID=47479 RepID=A0A7W7RY84_9ACTN|nr:TetR/AcrR family transcriptional regulator [Streptosporangium album]MBB4940449.1 AcrR family transcriptional regulator [Streptosporangium album]